MPSAAPKPTNLSLDPALVEEARAPGVDVSRAAEAGLTEALRRAQAEAWLAENAEAVRSSSEGVERNGLPLEAQRLF